MHFFTGSFRGSGEIGAMGRVGRVILSGRFHAPTFGAFSLQHARIPRQASYDLGAEYS